MELSTSFVINTLTKNIINNMKISSQQELRMQPKQHIGKMDFHLIL